jgi:hypothetical protein
MSPIFELPTIRNSSVLRLDLQWHGVQIYLYKTITFYLKSVTGFPRCTGWKYISFTLGTKYGRRI